MIRMRIRKGTDCIAAYPEQYLLKCMFAIIGANCGKDYN